MIKKFLQNNIRYSYNAPTIYRKLNGKIPLNTIRIELKRLCDRGEIRRVSRGFYQAKVDMETINLLENPPTLLHAITIVADVPKLQKRVQGTSRSNFKRMDFLEWLEQSGFVILKYNDKSERRRYSKVVWFDDRDVHIHVHVDNATVTIYFGCSKHPLSYLEFRDLYNRVYGFLEPITPFVNERVTQIGINKDFREFDLDGVNSIRLRDFANAWFQIYRKESIAAVRFECHLNTRPVLSLQDAYFILESFSRPFVGHNHVGDNDSLEGYV